MELFLTFNMKNKITVMVLKLSNFDD